MIKKIAIVMFALLPLGIMAQTLKIGHINSQEILMQMPELDELDKKIQEASEEWENLLLKMQEEFNAKIKEYQDGINTMSESIKEARQSEIAQLEQRLNLLNQQAQADIGKKNQELAAPIIEKVKNAIDAVAKENNFTYIFDMASQSIIYTAPNAQDITALVKKKLNLPDKPVQK